MLLENKELSLLHKFQRALPLHNHVLKMETYKKSTLSLNQIAMRDASRLGLDKPFMYAHYMIDFSRMRTEIRHLKKENDILTSAVILKLIATKTKKYPYSTSMLKGKKVYKFDDVDVFLPIATKKKDVKGCILKNASEKTVAELTKEIRSNQNLEYIPFSLEEKLFLNLPNWSRNLYYKLQMRRPARFKQLFGNLFVSFIYADFEYAYSTPPHNFGVYIGAVNSEGKTPFTFCLNHELVDGQTGLILLREIKHAIEHFTLDMIK